MNKRTGIIAAVIIAAFLATIHTSPSHAHNGYTVDAMDGTVTLTDPNGDWMTIPANCAQHIADNTPDLQTMLKDGTTETHEYKELCFA